MFLLAAPTSPTTIRTGFVSTSRAAQEAPAHRRQWAASRLRVGPTQVLDALLERGREEERLAVGAQLADDRAHLRLEAHLEHTVCLVQHQVCHTGHLHIGQPVREDVRAAAAAWLYHRRNLELNHVQQSARRGHYDLTARLRNERFNTLRHPTGPPRSLAFSAFVCSYFCMPPYTAAVTRLYTCREREFS
jgi:hypothetical protein